ncbi:MAG: hypothetical protein Q8S00_22210 [Deltaproteobacteria bacterium]|nr:hypothetical protein [Deltaproteobacteria bacterium]
MKHLAFLSLLIVSVSGSVIGADQPFDRLVAARSLRCSLGPGSTVYWETGMPIVKGENSDSVLQFDSIDTKTRKARFIGNKGVADVTVLLTPSGMTFLEETTIGNLTITTVFPTYAKNTRDYIVVHSRHIVGFGSPLPSQYHGTCKVWQ